MIRVRGIADLQLTSRGREMPMTRRTAVQAVVLTIFALSGTGCSYNTFVGQEEAIKAQWAQVENQLQRGTTSFRTWWKPSRIQAAHEEGST